MIYFMLADMILSANKEEQGSEDALRHVLRRHISCFNIDEDG